MSRMGSEGRECDLLSERVGDWPGSQRPTGCGRGTGAGLGEGRGTVGVVGEIAGLRGDGCGAVGGLGRRAWPWRGRGPKLEVSTEAGRRGEISIGGGGLGPPADAHFGRGPPHLACPALRAVQPPELPTGNLPQPRFSAEVGVHTSDTEGQPAPTKNPSHRPQPAQAQCTQAARVESPALEPASRACAAVHAPLSGEGSQRPGLRRRSALGGIPAKTRSWTDRPAQARLADPAFGRCASPGAALQACGLGLASPGAGGSLGRGRGGGAGHGEREPSWSGGQKPAMNDRSG